MIDKRKEIDISWQDDRVVKAFQKQRGETLAKEAIVSRQVIIKCDEKINLYESIAENSMYKQIKGKKNPKLVRVINQFEKKRKRFDDMLEDIEKEIEFLAIEMKLEKGDRKCLDCLAFIQDAFMIAGGS